MLSVRDLHNVKHQKPCIFNSQLFYNQTVLTDLKTRIHVFCKLYRYITIVQSIFHFLRDHWVYYGTFEISYAHEYTRGCKQCCKLDNLYCL